MFAHIRQKLLYNTLTKYSKQKRSNTTAIHKEIKDEIRDIAEPIYPPIEDVSYKAKLKKKKQIWYDQIKFLETVEEKQIKINMPRYYGWKLLLLKEHNIPYNSLEFSQYITRTHIVKEPILPAYYNDVISTEQLDNMVQEIKKNIEDSIIFESCIRRRDHEISSENLQFKTKIQDMEMDDIMSKALIQNINRTMLIYLSSKYEYLLDANVDIEPRLEASWFVGSEPPENIKNFRRKFEGMKDYADIPINIPVQYLGQPVIHLRHKYPLKEIIPLSECENPALDIPTFKYNAKTLGYNMDRRHITNIPGFWPGDPNEFGVLSYHNCPYLQIRPEKYNDTSEALTVQAIFASYSWLLSQANYQGFSTFHDITYPLITQTIITNGQWWSFFIYQLNTTLVHFEHVDENPKRNVCWITEPMKLFDKIENEKIHGLNEEVLKSLIKFYANTPQERIGVNLKPYLGKSMKVVADIEHDEKRNWLEERYKHLVSNRQRHHRIPEIYNWQRIYLKRFKTRPMDKKREPWEFGINPFKRKLDEHPPPYVPRCLRENPKKRKVGRYKKMYYP